MFYAMIGAGVIVAGLATGLAIIMATQLPKLMGNDLFQGGLVSSILGLLYAVFITASIIIGFRWLILPFTLAKKLDEQTLLLTQIRDSLASRTPPR